MRSILILCATILVAGAAVLVWSSTRPEHYGPAFAGAPKAAVKDLLEKPEEHLGRDVAVEGTIVRQCPATGCWLFLKDVSGKDIRVEMNTIAPKFPQRGGRRAIVEGRLAKNGDSYEIDGKAVEFR
ncbi:MAG: hypothetical protein FJ291_30405 [Planctomycetes bacterium]|nr:hypothetical protein [Planctomycetota bacterium]